MVTAGNESARWLRASVAAAFALALVGMRPNVALAAEPGPDALPIHVLAVTSDDADDQAEALTSALRNAVRATQGFALASGDYSLEVLALEMKCGKPPVRPDSNCESRIADQIKTDRYVWAILKKDKGPTVSGELHFWVRGRGASKLELTYAANLTEPNDDSLRKIAVGAIEKITGGPPKGAVHLKVGDVGGQVFLDDQPVGALNGGEGTFALSAGKHTVVVKAVGYADAVLHLAVRPNATTEVPVTLVAVKPSAPLNAHKIGGYAGIGAGVALLGAGVFSSLQVKHVTDDAAFQLYQSQYVSATDVCAAAKAETAPDPRKQERSILGSASFASARDSCDRAQRFEMLQFVFYGLAAVSGGTGLYLLSTSPREAPQTGVTVQPALGFDGGRVAVTYTF